MDTFLDIFKEAGFIMQLIIWLIVLAPAIICGYFTIDLYDDIKRGKLTDKKVKRNLVIFVPLDIICIGLLITLFVSGLGIEMIKFTISSGAVWLLIAIGIILSIPISLAGSQFREAIEFGGSDCWIKGLLGIIIPILISIILFLFMSPIISLIFGGLSLVAFILGIFGRFLIPNIEP